MTLDQLIQLFLDQLSSRASQHTVRSYATDLAQLSTFLKGELELTPESLKNFLRAAAPGSKTRARKLSTLRSFIKFLRSIEYLSSEPTELIDAPIRRKHLPKLLNQHQMEELLDQPGVGRTPFRDLAILELLYASGLRASELDRATSTFCFLALFGT